MKYRVGEFVMVRSDLRAEKNNDVSSLMVKYAGKKAKIAHISGERYIVEIRDLKLPFLWTDDMFEEADPWKMMNELTKNERQNAVDNYLFLLQLAKQTKDAKWQLDIKTKLQTVTKKVKSI